MTICLETPISIVPPSNLRVWPLKGFLNWQGTLQGPSTRLVCSFRNYRDTRPPPVVPQFCACRKRTSVRSSKFWGTWAKALPFGKVFQECCWPNLFGLASSNVCEETLSKIVDVTIAYPERDNPLDLLDIIAAVKPPCTTHVHYRVFDIKDVSHHILNFKRDKWP